ncbi:MAG: hypothetical protein JO061_24595, partial [Acidobacteriaceae bacterium]|nr:hypothetical protein [Acidobacteriaceae bacterium]
LHAAQSLISTLKSEHESARACYLEAREKAGFEFDFEVSDRRLEGLQAWFDRLRSANAETAPASLVTALKNWTRAAQEALTGERATFARARSLLDTRSELRGRLDALKAKARAFSLAENDELIALADRATALLYGRPTPMDEAASLVAAYEAKLNSQARRFV